MPPTSVVSAGSLALGFGVAQASGVRALGGAVLVLGAAACTRTWLRQGPATTATLLGTFAAAFVGAHVLAPRLGAWPSVAAVSGVMAATAWMLSDRRPTYAG